MAESTARALLISKVQVPNDSSLNTGLLSRGIDNYHIDIRLSDDFVLHARELIDKVVKRVAAGSRPFPNTEDLEDFRETYRDVMTTSLHRTKSDMVKEELQVLQFGVLKFLLKEVRVGLQKALTDIEETVAQQQYAGSRSLLATQEKLAWFRKHHDDYLYRANRAMLQQVQREENALRELRKQIMPDDDGELLNVMFNPMLCSDSPIDTSMLAECYALWPSGGKDFASINLRLEDTLEAEFPELLVKPLKNEARIEATEVFDTLHGLFSSQDILGPSEDQNTLLTESYSWLEQPANVRLMFDSVVQDKALKAFKDGLGMKAQWDVKGDLKKIQKVFVDLQQKLFTDITFKEAVACYQIRGDWSPKDQQLMDIRLACAYVAGNEPKKVLAKLDLTKDAVAALIRRLDGLADALPKLIKEEGQEYHLRLLADMFRYRLHLKYFRFAHRTLNRIRVLLEPEDIQLAKAGGQLYELLRACDLQELQSDEPQIVRHVILKADVRGSTTLTRELLKQDLNPASYFSTRFFGPITERLEVYGAVKVFIEGDAVILGIYEHDQVPDHWYCVARACGMAKEILDIVSSKNTHTAKTGIPGLEVGIGICFEDDKPLFLFDEEKPIMISAGIGDADRLSSCSWRLREHHSGPFNVDVRVDTAGAPVDPKGAQAQLQYNVNGISLSPGGFKKLMSEVPLKKLKLKLGDSTETLFVTRFPDVKGKERDLVIREGRVSSLGAESASEPTSGELFYEVLPNSKLARQVLDLSKKSA